MLLNALCMEESVLLSYTPVGERSYDVSANCDGFKSLISCAKRMLLHSTEPLNVPTFKC